MKLILPARLSRDPPHISRLKEVGRWRLPAEGSKDWINFRLHAAAAMSDPSHRRRMKEATRRCNATFRAISENGAGLPADSLLREFIHEYNNRTIQFGLTYLPASYNIIESFVEYRPELSLFIPLPEKAHICTIDDFLKFRSNGSNASVVECCTEIDEGTIYSFSFLDDPRDWIFESGESKFAVSAVNLVRHEHEITAMFLVGQEADLKAESKAIADAQPSLSNNPEKPRLRIDSDRTGEAVQLCPDTSLWRCMIAFRFDLIRKCVQVRYIARDCGNTWNIITDDPLTLEFFPPASRQASCQIERIEGQKGIFSSLLQFLCLPHFFTKVKDRQTLDKSVTQLEELRNTLKGRWLKHAVPSQVFFEREVSTLPPAAIECDGFALTQFELRVERDGYWERLPLGMYGADKEGNRVLGKNWVHRTLSRREASIPGTPLRAQRSTRPLVSGGEEGFIYVLRNASHHADMFKVGMTRRSATERATELSRGTAVPDKFLTVQEWWVPDVRFAERRIHQLLDDYRINDGREFFRAKYQIIRSAIEQIVGELAGRPIS